MMHSFRVRDQEGRLMYLVLVSLVTLGLLANLTGSTPATSAASKGFACPTIWVSITDAAGNVNQSSTRCRSSFTCVQLLNPVHLHSQDQIADDSKKSDPLKDCEDKTCVTNSCKGSPSITLFLSNIMH